MFLVPSASLAVLAVNHPESASGDDLSATTDPAAVIWQRVTRPDSFLPSPSAARAQASTWLAPRPHPIDIWKPSRSPNKHCACLMKAPQFRSGGLGAQPGPEGLDPTPGPTRWSGLAVNKGIRLPSKFQGGLPHAGVMRVLSVSQPSLSFGNLNC